MIIATIFNIIRCGFTFIGTLVSTRFIECYTELVSTSAPTMTDVTFMTYKPTCFYVHAFRGFVKSSGQVLRKRYELESALKHAMKMYMDNIWFVAMYDSPYRMFNRHNEVWLEKKTKDM